MKYQGHLSKMHISADGEVAQYSIKLDEQLIPINEMLGQPITIEYLGDIHCQACGRVSKKSFAQGYCYPCFSRLAQCDTCIMSPEKCHYDKGTCREPKWGEEFCMQDHIVYLANSSGIKVGITRHSQIPTRWLDQGAMQALPIARVETRQLSGLLEVIFKQHVADKTNWRTLLKQDAEDLNLSQKRDELFEMCHEEIEELQSHYGLQAVQLLYDGEQHNFAYPVEQYPTKVASLNLDKNPIAQGKLMGIKGQYLILDTGVINLRKYTSYLVSIEC
ncbi:DUF2797 domain-containing protein [Oceaniserpentilla sp. 4NH20-0058]|uniref:DUF2797 domain-containing protein n=1 Tax=Oceaniserpentilla sp. 4NH20-0058 TaxID=3127660 RepID=UPI003108A6A1